MYGDCSLLVLSLLTSKIPRRLHNAYIYMLSRASLFEKGYLWFLPPHSEDNCDSFFPFLILFFYPLPYDGIFCSCKL